LPDDIGESDVTIGHDEASVRLRPKGRVLEDEVFDAYEPTATAVPMDARARKYPKAFASADLLYESTPRGLKETIVLASPSKKNTFSFDMTCPGLVPSLDTSGGVVFTRVSTGEVLFNMVPPFMTDASLDAAGEPAHSDAVHYELKQLGAGWRLDVVADEAWLADPERVYPVKIDPTTYWTYTFQDYDTYVSDAYPTTNYGTSTQARVGRYNAGGTGATRTYVRPELSGLPDNISVLYARLEAYCYDRTAASGTSRVNCASLSSSWTEYGLTWNTQPVANYITYDDVAEGSWGAWNVTSAVQNYVLGLATNNGFRLYSSSESTDLTLCKFYTRDSTGVGARLTVDFTTEPTVEIVSPSLQVPVRSDATTIHAVVRYDDALGKKLCKVQAQVASSIVAPTIVRDVSVVTSAPVVEIPAPSAGWGTQERYWVRARVWGAGDGDLEDYSAPSGWTEWQPFDRKPLTSSNNGAGLLPWHATDPVGAGLSVDLATGHLVGSRSDFSGPGLGLPITYGATYDSSLTTADAGLGKGWRMAAPSLTYAAQKAPNPSFDETPFVGDGNDPPGWFINDSAHTVWSTTATSAPYSLKLWYPTTAYGNVWVATSSGAENALPVAPGERITASAWVRTESFNPDTTQDECGALMKFHFFDGKSVEMTHTTFSKVSEGFCAPSTTSWKQITLEATVPVGAYGAQLNLELRNAKGTVRFDDVEFCDKTIDFTDGDGTSRTIAPAENGAYKRDPLEPGVAFSRVNVAREASVTAIGGDIDSESVDGIINDCADLGNYDGVLENASGANHLTYDLGHAQVLSEADLYLWDGGLEVSEATQPLYTYRIEASEDGKTFTRIVPASTETTTGRGWMKHTFAPVRARYVRVVALNNTYDTGFRVCEIDLPQLRLGDAVVCFDAAGRLQATGDLSGNPVKYTYDASGKLTGVADATRAGSTEATRGLELDWSGNALASLDWRGVSSTGAPKLDEDVVRFESVTTTSGSEYRVLRTSASTETAVLTYLYDIKGRISGAKDADGIGYRVEYNETTNRVYRVFQSGIPTETVTTFTYGAGYTGIYHGGNGVNAATRYVSYSSALGNQPTAVRVDPSESPTDLVTSVAYDEYAHPWKTTDPLGRITRTNRDGSGNVVVAAACNSAGAVLQQSQTEYDDDHMSQTIDNKGNESSLRYDDAWRVLVASQAVSDDTLDGSSDALLTYDDWGNQATSSVDGSTAYNLLRNGTFEATPTVTGNGWDGTKAEDPDWTYADQLYTGHKHMVLGDTDGPEYITSDEVAVDPSKTYTLSAWVEGSGQVIVNEYATNHGFLQSRGMIQSTGVVTVISRPAGAPVQMRRVSVTYVPSSGTAFARIRPYTADYRGFEVDNIRLELANGASPDCFAENESMEQVEDGLPKSWTRRSSTQTTATHEATSDEQVSGRQSAHIKHTSTSAMGYFYGPQAAMSLGERYTVSVSMKTVDSKGGAKAIVRFFGPLGTPMSSDDTTLTGGAVVKGTTEWCRYVKDISVPRGAASMAVNLYHESGGGDAYWDAVTIAPAAGISTTEYDAATHSVAVKSTTTTGISVGSATDSRGRSVETSVQPRGETTVTLSARSYDDLDRLTGVETAPGAGLGITAAFTYTDAGRLETVTGPRSATTTMAYDAAGRLTGVFSPLGTRSRLRYDALGRLFETFWPSESVEPTSVASRVTYDSLGRTGSTDVFAGDGSLYAHTVPTYDLASRVTTTVISGQVTGTVGVTYDDLDRATTAVVQGPSGTTTSTVIFEADSNLPVTVKTTALESSRTITNTWAKTGQLLRFTSVGQTWVFGFGNSGGLSSAFSPGLSMRTSSYDVSGRLTTVRMGRPYDENIPFREFAESTILYDSQDRIWRHAVDSEADLTDEFSYDAASRVTSWARTGSGATSAAYAYDPSGNLTTATVGATTTAFSYDIGDRLTRSAAGSAVTTYTNDILGRRTSSVTATGTTTYTWDPLSHLTAVTTPDTTATYAYGPTGMRELKTVTTATGTTSTRSVYAGAELAMELDSDGTRYTYLWGPGRLPLSVTRERTGEESETFAYQVDAMGSVIGMTDEDGTVVARYSYDPWGRVTDETAIGDEIASRNPLRYRAYYHDAETGLYYMPARFYDPATYRFLSADPASPSTGDPGSLNAFAYCGDDPIGLDDPSGADPPGKGIHKKGTKEYDDWNEYLSRIPCVRYRRIARFIASCHTKLPPPLVLVAVDCRSGTWGSSIGVGWTGAAGVLYTYSRSKGVAFDGTTFRDYGAEGGGLLLPSDLSAGVETTWSTADSSDWSGVTDRFGMSFGKGIVGGFDLALDGHDIWFGVTLGVGLAGVSGHYYADLTRHIPTTNANISLATVGTLGLAGDPYGQNRSIDY